MPAGFFRTANPGILDCMRKTSVPLGLLFGLLLEGCYDHRNSVRGLPIAPVAVNDSRSASAPLESKPAVVESNTPSIPEPIAPLSNEPASIKYSLNELLFELADAYFDLDQHDLREDGRIALRSDASLLKRIAAQSSDTPMLVEGHCDERGSAEYNLALGAMRAEAAKGLLVELGIPNTSLKTITYGKERPQCTIPTEECWQKNRRAHLAPE